MDSKFVLAFLILGFVIISGCAQQTSNETGVINGGELTPGNSGAHPTTEPELAVGEFIVERTNEGYNPETLTIKKGSKVTFENNSNSKQWPASARHPTHTAYPGSDIQKCQTAQKESIFDACKGLEPGESYSFTFNEVGEWGFHDHLNSGVRGKIIVVE